MESSNSSRLKFWQIVAMKRALKKKKFIAPEQINMSFPFAYIKCQAKQFYTQWTDFFFLVF